ncbi:MAG TPA: AgmX/PglI C-terminal domain-containing protein, partial [Caldithrix sp.]|nr:AgmX/PglI C-terminal domain-containing protein [Caldithrix sp.]
YVIRKDNRVRNAVSKIRKKRSSYAQWLKGQEKSKGLYRKLVSGETGAVEAITAALDGVAGFAGLPDYSFRRERSLTLRNEENYLKEYEKPIHISKPEVFHFASQNGNRSLEETTAVMSLNEHDVKYCIDKSKRYDPTFTGDILVRFTIHPNGYVIPSSIKIIKSNITDIRVIRCIKKSIRRWRNFPRIALEEGSFTVTRKYVF